MSNKIKKTNIAIVAIMIFAAAMTRLISLPPNFSPIGAMALFGAAYFGRKWMALAIPFVAIWLSSLVLNNTIYAEYYEGFVWFTHPFVYIAFGVVVGFGFLALKKVNPQNLVMSSFAASVIFFLVSNFGSWLMSGFYTPDFAGLITCYGAGIPFFGWTILGDLFFVGVLFGGYEMIKRANFSFLGEAA